MKLLPRRVGWLLPVLGALSALAAGMTPALAQAKLEARYTATLSGITVGRGAWEVVIGEDQFTAAATGAAGGVLRLFTSGRGTTLASGIVSAGRFVPGAYASSIIADKKADEVRMSMGGGMVKEFTATPPAKPDPLRIPITEAHRKGVVDPMTASLARVAGTGDPVSSEACARTVPIFDGRIRYDLRLAFKRTERVQAEKGYQGPVVICSVGFTAVAGHIPDRPVIRYLMAEQNMEIALAPIANTRVLVPYRIVVPTPVGVGVLEATQFVATPMPASASAKTQ